MSKSKKNKYFRYALLFLCTCLTTSCMLVDLSAPPYLIISIVPVITSDEESDNYTNITFNIANTSEKTITSFLTSCFLYDGKTRKPLMHNNRIRSTFSGIIAPKENRIFLINLDTHISEIPDSPFIIDFFTILQIEYSDGSVWTDPYCMWYTGYGV